MTSNASPTQALHPRTSPTIQEARFWMNTPVITTGPNTPLSEALALMHEHSIRRLPVVLATGQVCGIITEGDIRGGDMLRACGMALSEVASALCRTRVYELMTEPPILISPTTTLREAALVMLDNKIGGLPVVDDANSVVGIITESDLFEALVCYLDRASPDA